MERLMTAKQVSELLGVSCKTVYRLALQRRLPSVRLTENGSVRFEPGEITRWLQQRRRQDRDSATA